MSQQINLFNPGLLKKKNYFSAMNMVQSLGLILLGAALVVAYVNYQLIVLNKEAVAVTARLGAAQAQLAKFNGELVPRQKSKALENEIVKSEADVKSMQKVFDTLRKGEFGNTKGYSDYLRAFSRQIVGGLWLTGFSIDGAGNEIGIQGRATKPDLIPAYIGRLKGETVMQGKTFSTLEMSVPPAEQSSRAVFVGTTIKPALANFIEFNLQSHGLAKEVDGGLEVLSK